MAMTPDSRPRKSEHPSTYVVQDRPNEAELIRLNEAELIRLDGQDHTLTEFIGVMAEQKDPARFERVLDVGCGTGGWLIEAARTYPNISTLAGVDTSERLVSYAREQAQAAEVSDRAQFQIGDALRMLEFPTGYFDLVNQRLGISYLRQWDWPKILREYQRVCKPDGIICITDRAVIPETNSLALIRLTELLTETLYRAGHLFTLESEGLTRHLAALMHQHGLQQVQTKITKIGCQTPAMKLAAGEDARRAYQQVVPLMRKWIKLPSDYRDIYDQLASDSLQPDFESASTFITAWGTVV